ncbi:MAG: hypothetical protein K8H88_15200, partial [Sandaracinaceae bacterium]|nr:hypothetical protein [Sandaracinaceae bacterium]
LQGTIQLVDMRVPELVIHTESATRRVRLGPMTVIVIAGMPATASELRPGQRVAVQLHVTGGGVVRDLAARIVVLR